MYRGARSHGRAHHRVPRRQLDPHARALAVARRPPHLRQRVTLTANTRARSLAHPRRRGCGERGWARRPRQLSARSIQDGGHESDCEQGLPAEVEEIVVDPDGTNLQQVLPDPDQQRFRLCARAPSGSAGERSSPEPGARHVPASRSGSSDEGCNNHRAAPPPPRTAPRIECGHHALARARARGPGRIVRQHRADGPLGCSPRTTC